MKILPLSTYSQINFKNRTAYYENQVIEEDLATLKQDKSYFTNPISPNKDFIGINLIRESNDTIYIKSRFDHIIGKIIHNPNLKGPTINIISGAHQPIIELIDENIGIKILLKRGAKLNSPELKISYEELNKQDIQKNSALKNIIFKDEKAESKYKQFANKYNISKLEGNITVLSLSGKKYEPVKIETSSKIAQIAKENPEKFIEIIMKNPEDLKEISTELINTYGKKNFLNWYLSKDGYYGAYEKYVEKIYKNAKSIEELLKFMPNWSPWKLEEKYWQQKYYYYACVSPEYSAAMFQKDIQKTTEQPFTIGKLPPLHFNKKSFNELVAQVKEDNQKNGIIYSDKGIYQVKRLKGGDLNDKNIYLVTNQGKKFILKTDRSYPEDNDNLSLYDKKVIKKNKVLTADSNFTNACISKYLELNGCDKIPKLLYYDYKTDAALYEYIEDVKGDLFQKGLLDEEYSDLNLNNSVIKELRKYGIFLNDTALKNFFTEPEGNEKIIDLGHANFIMPFKPGVKHYNIEFSNTNGPDFRTIYASLLT